LTDRDAISIFPEPGRRGKQQVFEFTEHDYYYIVFLTSAHVKRALSTLGREDVSLDRKLIDDEPEPPGGSLRQGVA
jgi:hypothetical protein